MTEIPIYRNRSFLMLCGAMALLGVIYAWPAGPLLAVAVGVAGGIFAAFVLWLLGGAVRRWWRRQGW